MGPSQPGTRVGIVGILVRAAVLACLAMSACRSTPADPTLAATSFVRALNAKNIDAMVQSAATPFSFRNQAWQSAPDGRGIVPGATTEHVARSTEELRTLFRDLTAKVEVAQPTAVANPPSKADLLSEPLRGAAAPWRDLELVLFRRGEGDVEHIAIVGVDARGKIAGMYVN